MAMNKDVFCLNRYERKKIEKRRDQVSDKRMNERFQLWPDEAWKGCPTE